jgi:hypothetical protein
MTPVSLKSPYRTKAGKPWMRNSWVVFLDILGFSAQIECTTKAGTANDLLAELIAAIEEAKVDLVSNLEESSEFGASEAPYAVKMFTDNVVLGFPIRDDGESEFGRMIYIVALWQFTLLKHGFFVRGGMTVGPIYLDDDVAFGQGMLDAYEAESKLARDPRVVLAAPAMDLIHHHLAYYADVSESPQNVSLLVDADSQMFVNYLYLPVDGADELSGDFVSHIEHHRELIVARLSTFSLNPSVWSKYAWVGAYHNHFCEHYEGLKHLKVDPQLLVQAPRFLSQLYKREADKVIREGKEVARLKYLSQWRVEKEPK